MSIEGSEMSILSLKHITHEGDQQAEQKNMDKNNNIETAAASQSKNNNLTQQNSISSPTKFQTNTQQNSDSKSIGLNPNPSGNSISFLNRNSNIDLGIQNSEQTSEYNSAGAIFLRQMFASNQPMRNYMTFLKKDQVDLTDEKDATVVMQILQKQNKSKNECNFLMKSIQGLHLFQKNKDMLTMKDCNQQLLEKLRLEYYPARKTIFNYGAADLLIPAPILDDKQKQQDTAKNSENKDQKKENITVADATVGIKKGLKKIKFDSKWNVLKKTFNPDQENMPLADVQVPAIDEEQHSLQEDETHEEFLKRSFPGMNYIKTFSPGEAFGEIALMTKQRRTATLVCREGTYLMALTKESFDVILGSYHQNITQRKLNFLKTYNFFRNMPNSKLLALLHLMKIVNYRNKNIVYTENDPSRFIYFIREGEVQISQMCNIEEKLDKEQKKKDLENDNPNEINAIRAQKDMRNKNKRVPIVIKGKDSYFGEDEILKHVDTRKQQAICNSESAEIFLLKKDILYNYTRGYSVIEKLKEEFKIKAEWNQIRQANIVQIKQSTKMDIEKQINSLNQKSIKSQTQTNISDYKVENKQSSSSNIFSINPKQNNTLSIFPQTSSLSLTNINSSGLKRMSLLLPSTTNNTQQNGSYNIDPIDVIAAKQRLSLRANTLNPNSLNTYQKQFETSQISRANSQNEENDHFFSNGIGQSVINGYMNNDNKLTSETKVHLKLKQGKRDSNFSNSNAPLGLIAINENQNQTPLSKQPLTINEEENYIENKVFNNLKRKYYGVNQKTKEQLAQVALEQFGDMSHNAYVNKLGQTIEYKMQILKKLNSNGLNSPTNVFADLYEEFGLKKKNTNFKIRKSINSGHQSSQTNIKDNNSKNASQMGNNDFQKKIIQERKQQIKENIKKQNTQSCLEDINLISEQIHESTPSRNSRTFHQQYSYTMSDTNTETFNRSKNRASTTISTNSIQHSSSLIESRRVLEKAKSIDELSHSSIESYSSQGNNKLLKRHSLNLNERGFKQPTLAQIKNLDVLEEVSENNSPLKSGVESRMILELINKNELKDGLNQYLVKPQPQLSHEDYKIDSKLSSSYYSNKSFMNRHTPSLKQKLDARKVISRYLSSSKENSFRITTNKNNYLTLQKNLSQGNIENASNINSS